MITTTIDFTLTPNLDIKVQIYSGNQASLSKNVSTFLVIEKRKQTLGTETNFLTLSPQTSFSVSFSESTVGFVFNYACRR